MSLEINKSTLVLVSNSPRRRELLSTRGFRMEVASPPSELKELSEGDPEFVVSENAKIKVEGYFCKIGDTEKFRKIYLGVDTIVEYDGKILGKPENSDEARDMIKSLSGLRHNVYTALHLIDGENNRSLARLCKTSVVFRELSDEIIDRYVASGDPLDKAGAYGIQSFAGLFIERIEGCYYNVVGLPLSALCECLKNLGHDAMSFMV
jgi:septum formation protein